jgi:hypothetical protein
MMRRSPASSSRRYGAESPAPGLRLRRTRPQPAAAPIPTPTRDAPFHISALDFGSTHVKAAVCRVEAGRLSIFGHGVQPHAGDLRARDALLAAAERALTDAEELTPQTLGEPIVADRCVISISALGAIAAAPRVAYQRRASAEPLDEAEWQRILLSVQREALQPLYAQAVQEIAEPALLIPASAVHIWLDGRKVDDPVGLRGRTIEASVFNAFLPAETLDSAEALADRLQLDPPEIVLQASALLAGRRESLGLDGVGIDIGGRHTSLMLWRAGALLGLAAVPHGGRDLTVNLGRACQADEARAEKLKLNYAAGQYDPGQRASISESLQSALGRWFDAVAAALAGLAGGAPLPPAIWVWGGGAQLPDSMTAARALAGRAGLDFAGFPVVRPLQDVEGERIANHCGAPLGPMGVNVAAAPWGIADLADAPALRSRLRQATEAACQAEQITYWIPANG